MISSYFALTRDFYFKCSIFSARPLYSFSLSGFRSLPPPLSSQRSLSLPLFVTQIVVGTPPLPHKCAHTHTQPPLFSPRSALTSH